MHITSTFIVAASSLFPLAFSAPVPSPASSLAERDIAYRLFGGNGTVRAGWPNATEWNTNFEKLWTANKRDLLSSSCDQFNVKNNNEAEIDTIYHAIGNGSAEAGVPKEFILAIMMQESKGCVRAPTTNYGHDNPGLMQSFEGTASCNRGGVVTYPCPDQTIKDQIYEGLGLNGRPFGLRQALKQAENEKFTGPERFYRAARIYNSGTVIDANLGAGIATHCYASDVANRLMGWTKAQSLCEEATIASFSGSTGTAQQGNTEGNGNGNTNTETPKPTPTQSNTNTNTQNNGNSDPSGPKAPGAASNCKTWYTVKPGDTCAGTGHESALRNLNQIDANCGNLWLGYAYCIAQ